MKQNLMGFALAVLVSVVMTCPALAAAKGDVVVELKGQKVVTTADKKETFESADKAKPGDVIEYRATYNNTGEKTAANLKATIPIPPGTEYLPGSAKPAKVLASTDGKEFAPAPLKRKVTLESGKTEMRDIPARDYRALRWELSKLAPAEHSTFSLRVRISTEPPQGTAPAK